MSVERVSERCKRKEQLKAKLKVIIASVKKLLLALPRSQLTHVGVSFTRLRRINGADIYRGLFLDKTQLATPLSLSLSLQSIFA